MTPSFSSGAVPPVPPTPVVTGRYAATDNAGLVATPSAQTTHTTEVSRLRFVAKTDMTGPAPIYVNFGYPDADNANSITIAAAVEYPVGTFTALTFSSASSVALAAGASVEADAHALAIPNGATFYIRTGTTVTAGQSYYCAHGTIDTLHEGVERDGGTSKVTSGTVTEVYGEFVNGPIAVLSTGTYRRTVALVGDSIQNGLNVGRDQAFGVLACLSAAAGYIQLGASSEKAQGFATAGGRDRRITLVDKCSNALCAYGANDLLDQARTLAQLQADQITIWTACKAVVSKVFQTTLTPLTTSTDAWATTANQTANSGNSDRVSFNDWIRDGAPISGGAAVATGTVGATRAGDAAHPLEGYFDVADAVESARNSGKWKVATGVLTSDGVHPNVAGNVLMADAIDGSRFA